MKDNPLSCANCIHITTEYGDTIMFNTVTKAFNFPRIGVTGIYTVEGLIELFQSDVMTGIELSEYFTPFMNNDEVLHHETQLESTLAEAVEAIDRNGTLLVMRNDTRCFCVDIHFDNMPHAPFY